MKMLPLVVKTTEYLCEEEKIADHTFLTELWMQSLHPIIAVYILKWGNRTAQVTSVKRKLPTDRESEFF